MGSALFIVVLVVLILVGLFVIPRFLMKRAIKRVIQIFHRYNALDAKTAKAIDELGLRPRTFLENMFRSRDYKPYALELLRKGDIIRTTEDGRLYLSEEKLALSALGKR